MSPLVQDNCLRDGFLRNYDEMATEVLNDCRGEVATASVVGQELGMSHLGTRVAAFQRMMARILALGPIGLCLWSLFLSGTLSHAQSVPNEASVVTADGPGLLPAHEINGIVRAAGFSPLPVPRREGGVYVLRAIDRHDVLMRIVVDARSGAIRAVNRLVSVKPIGTMANGPPSASDRRPAAESPLTAKDVAPGPAEYGASAAEPALGPQHHEIGLVRTAPADIGDAAGGAVGLAERGPDASSTSTVPDGGPPAVQDMPPLPRPRPSDLKIEKVRPLPKVRMAKPSSVTAPASVFSVAPHPGPTPAGKPAQIANPH
jgi:hypothetical protein